jgi:hypothetical protein
MSITMNNFTKKLHGDLEALSSRLDAEVAAGN